MIEPGQLADFLDDALDPASRQQVEQALEHDPAALRFLREQRQLDRLLRSALRPTAERKQLRQSILAAAAGLSTEQLRAQVLDHTSGPGHLPGGPRGLEIPDGPGVDIPDPATGSPSRTPRRRSWINGFRERFRPHLAWGYAAAVAFAALGLLLLTVERPRRPGPEIGRLTQIVGTPSVRQAGARNALEAGLGTTIRLGDEVITGDADRAEIQFLDGTTLRLHFNTRIGIPAVDPSSTGTNPPPQRPADIHLVRGQVWTVVRSLSNAPPYVIRTTAATAIARGTEFGVRLHRTTTNTVRRAPPATDSLTATLTVKEGVVEFANSLGSVQAGAMTESTARPDSPPTEPRRLQTLQIVRLGDSAAWLLITAPLDVPDAAERLATGGSWIGLATRAVPVTKTTANARVPTQELRIARVLPNSPALQAGLKPGDTLLALNGRPVTNDVDWTRALLLPQPDTVTLTLRRGEERRDVSLQAVHRPGLLPGPALSARQRTQLEARTGELLRNTATRSFPGSPSLRAAAENNHGVILELEDASGPAIRAYNRAVTLDPDVPLYHFNLALALRKIGSFDRAQEELEKAARLAPNSAEVRKRLAEIHSLLGDHTAALPETDALLRLDPRDHGLWELKAQLLGKLLRPAESADAARQAVDLEPSCPVALDYLANALHQQGRHLDAEQIQRNAIALAPFHPVLHLNLGVIQRARGQLGPAEQSFRHATELDPGFALAHRNLGAVLADGRDHAAAAAAFQKARELDPGDTDAHRRFGDMALRRRQFDQALQAYQDALEAMPHNPQAHYGLGETFRLRRQFAEAETHYLKAAELKPDYTDAFTARGIVQYELGRLDDAEKLYRKAIELNPREPAPYHNLGTLYREARGDLDAADNWFRQALELAPDDGESLGGLGLIAAARGQLAEAERLLRLAVTRANNSSGLHNNLGEVLRQRGRMEEAEPFYRKAIELDPDNPAPYGNLGILHAMRKQFPEAEKMFRELLPRVAGLARLPTLVNLATVCGEQGKIKEAERLFRLALEAAPNHPQIGNSFASFLADHRLQLDEALSLATQAVGSAPSDPNFLDTLGWVQAQRGELDAAETTLNKALQLAGEEPPASGIREHMKKLAEKKGAVKK